MPQAHLGPMEASLCRHALLPMSARGAPPPSDTNATVCCSATVELASEDGCA